MKRGVFQPAGSGGGVEDTRTQSCQCLKVCSGEGLDAGLRRDCLWRTPGCRTSLRPPWLHCHPEGPTRLSRDRCPQVEGTGGCRFCKAASAGRSQRGRAGCGWHTQTAAEVAPGTIIGSIAGFLGVCPYHSPPPPNAHSPSLRRTW